MQGIEVSSSFLHLTLAKSDAQETRMKSKVVMCKAGVNICPKNSETVYVEIWGILKLFGLINQKIFETVIEIFKQSQKYAL